MQDDATEIHNIYVCFIALLIAAWIWRLNVQFYRILEAKKHFLKRTVVPLDMPGTRSVSRLLQLHARADTELETFTHDVRILTVPLEVPKSGSRMMLSAHAGCTLRLCLSSDIDMALDVYFGVLRTACPRSMAKQKAEGGCVSVVLRQGERFVDVQGPPNSAAAEYVRDREQMFPIVVSAVLGDTSHIILYFSVDDVVNAHPPPGYSGTGALDSGTEDDVDDGDCTDDNYSSASSSTAGGGGAVTASDSHTEENQFTDVLLVHSSTLLQMPEDVCTMHDVYYETGGCSICLTNDNNVLLLPCRHCCLCEECYPRVNTCPMCRSEIAHVMVLQRNSHEDALGPSGEGDNTDKMVSDNDEPHTASAMSTFEQ
eukprot:PhM_4_TR10321/c0_g1_i1/m.20011